MEFGFAITSLSPSCNYVIITQSELSLVIYINSLKLAHRWPLVTSLRLHARAGSVKRCVALAPGAQNDPHVGNLKREGLKSSERI